jgi:hypothetical protein
MTLALGGILLLGTWFCSGFARPKDPINRQAFERIQPGMSREQVSQAIGIAPGDYRTGYFENRYAQVAGPPLVPGDCAWYGEQAIIAVGFDGERVTSKGLFERQHAPVWEGLLLGVLGAAGIGATWLLIRISLGRSRRRSELAQESRKSGSAEG